MTSPVPMLPTVDRATVWRNVPTTDDVAFICIDDGYVAAGGDPAAAADYVQQIGLAVTPFLTFYAASAGGFPPLTVEQQAHVDYLKRFIPAGRGPQCHCRTHVDLTTLTQAQQLNEMTKGRDFLARNDMFGKAPVLLRPPYGNWNDDTRVAAFQAGFKVLLKWTHTYSEFAIKPVRPGDILLCHFEDNLLDQLQAAVTAIVNAGLSPAYIVDYVH